MTLKLSECQHLTQVQSPEGLCLVSVTGRHMNTDVRVQTNVEQREERAEVPVCLVLQADGGKV
jgi:hypothetical protein